MNEQIWINKNVAFCDHLYIVKIKGDQCIVVGVVDK